MSACTDDEQLVAEREAKLVALGPRPPWWRPFRRRRWTRARASILAMDVSKLTAIMRRLYGSYEEIHELVSREHVTFTNIKRADGGPRFYVVRDGKDEP